MKFLADHGTELRRRPSFNRYLDVAAVEQDAPHYLLRDQIGYDVTRGSGVRHSPRKRLGANQCRRAQILRYLKDD